MSQFAAIFIATAFAIFSAAQQHGYLENCTPNPTPSNATLCGMRGNVELHESNKYANTAGAIVDSVEKCASLCARRIRSPELTQDYPKVYCVSFRYDPSNGFCQLSGLNMSAYVEQKSNGDSMFFANDCFNCGKICPPPIGENLLDNGDFEQSLLGPWVSYHGSTAIGHNSKTSYHCHALEDPRQNYHAACYLSQLVNLCAGLYIFQFDYKITPPKGPNATMLILSIGTHSRFPDPFTQFSWDATVHSGDKETWRTVIGFYRGLSVAQINSVPGSFQGYPYFALVSTVVPSKGYYEFPEYHEVQDISLDNMFLKRVPENPPLKHGAVSPLRNGGFESGEIAPWTIRLNYQDTNFSASVVKPGFNSTYALQLTPGNSARSVSLRQTIQPKANTSYLFKMEFHQINATRATNPDGYTISLDLKMKQSGEHQSILFQPLRPANVSISHLIGGLDEETLIEIGFELGYTILIDNVELLELAYSHIS